jgi:hypothetical protein
MRTAMKQETFIRLILTAMLDVTTMSTSPNIMQAMSAVSMPITQDHFVLPTLDILLIWNAMLDVIAASKAINAVQDMPAITMEDQFVMPIAKAMT